MLNLMFSKFSYFFISALILGGVGAVIYGFAQLLTMTEVPLCVQPLQDNIQASTSANLAGWWQPGFYQVEIAGAVTEPGVYQVPLDACLQDLIQLAGGLAIEADQQFISQQINLAQNLEDEQRFYIPFQEEAILTDLELEFCQLAGTVSFSAESSAESSSGSSCISINNSSAENLQQLTGIGEKRAADIIEQRPYQQLNELVSREVISESVFAEIKELICL